MFTDTKQTLGNIAYKYVLLWRTNCSELSENGQEILN